MLQKRYSFYFLFIIILVIYSLNSCSFYTASYENSAKIEVEHITATGDIHYEINIEDTPVDIIFAFTNVNEVVGSDTPDVYAESITVNGQSFSAPIPTNFEYSVDNQNSTYTFIETSTRELVESIRTSAINKNTFPLPAVPSFDVVNDTNSFGDVDTNGNPITVDATCRSVVGPILTGQGNRTLNIWVADDCWEIGGDRKHLVTTEMITALEEKFLKTGLDNDIYDWVTTILGPEWGDTGYSNLIATNNEITILLNDIDNDDSDNGGVVGYFWGANNYTDTVSGFPGSNERIMFVIDAVMYASPSLDGYSVAPGPGWTENLFWPKIVFSTLAHEFQHMIHFYQKNFVANAAAFTETWINEMCSMLIEDFLADKTGVEGPRGVSPLIGTAGSPGNSEGRLPIFNQYLTNNLIITSNFGGNDPHYSDYSVSYAFGAWLARNYGGVEFLNRVVSSPYANKEAIEYAVQAYTGGTESFERLLQRWGAAIFLSDKTEAPGLYQYNSGGWFTSAINGNNYNLGSINLYNYNPAPEFATSTFQLSSGLTDAGSNVYLLAKENASGKLAWDITIPQDVRLTVIFKGK
ncbi:MAG: peptidase M30 [Spirochaetales bacterium]|nr:peptidase M30 [Spirochaetales bacterium]